MSAVIIGSVGDIALDALSVTLDLFADIEDEDSLAPLDGEDRWLDDRRLGGDAVISLSLFRHPNAVMLIMRHIHVIYTFN